MEDGLGERHLPVIRKREGNGRQEESIDPPFDIGHLVELFEIEEIHDDEEDINVAIRDRGAEDVSADDQ